MKEILSSSPCLYHHCGLLERARASVQSDEMHAAVAKLLKNELPGPEWRCAVHQGCTGQLFLLRGETEEKIFGLRQGRAGSKILRAGRGNS